MIKYTIGTYYKILNHRINLILILILILYPIRMSLLNIYRRKLLSERVRIRVMRGIRWVPGSRLRRKIKMIRIRIVLFIDWGGNRSSLTKDNAFIFIVSLLPFKGLFSVACL